MRRLQLQICEPHIDHPLPSRDEYASFVDWPADMPFHFIGADGGGDAGHAGDAEDESSRETISLEEASNNNNDED